MKSKPILAFAFCIVTNVSSAQILNVDRNLAEDTLGRKSAFGCRLNFVIDKQKRDIIDFATNIEYDYYFNNRKNILIALANTDITLNGKTQLENNGYFQIRVRDNDKKKIAPDFYTQYQWNGVWGLEHRMLGGCNARFRCREKNKDDFYISSGFFYEIERWNTNLSGYTFGSDSIKSVARSNLRLNLSAKGTFAITKGVDASAVTYIQLPVTRTFAEFMKPRWISSVNVNFEVNKHLSLVYHYSHNMDYYRVLPVDPFFYEFEIGMLMKL
jgi:hypothetical protein